VQDGEVTRDFVAREVNGAERGIWRERVVAVQPVMAGYAASTGRLIPVSVLGPAA
jgi:F420H(2)-dependent quinone reductase